ncbi:MAG TPA: hypothetical protein VF407_08735 [Polyangiaceae bacterium]
MSDDASKLRVDETGITIPRVGRIDRSEITNAYLSPFGTPRVIVESRKRADFSIEVHSIEEGDEILHVLGFGVGQKKLQFESAKIDVKTAFYAALAVFGTLVFSPLSFGASLTSTALTFCVVFLLGFVARPKITIGLRGITFHRVLRRETLPFADVERIELRTEEGTARVVFESKNGRERRFEVGDADDTEYRAHAILERARAAFAHWQRSHPPSDLDVLLEREGRSFAEWRKALRALGRGGLYRAASVDRAKLERIALDPEKPARLRVAAEVALAPDEESDDALERRLAAADETSE